MGKVFNGNLLLTLDCSACFLFTSKRPLNIPSLFCSGSRSSKTFKPKKNIPEGSHQYELLKHAEATLGSGNLRMAVMLPDGEDLNEWVAVNSESWPSVPHPGLTPVGGQLCVPLCPWRKEGLAILLSGRVQPGEGQGLLPAGDRVTGNSLMVQAGHQEEFLHGKRCQALEVLSPSLQMSRQQLDVAGRRWGSATGWI